MGGGGTKTHESFTVTPSLTVATPLPPAAEPAEPAGPLDPPGPPAPGDPPAPVGGTDAPQTPIPAVLPVGEPCGAPILCGGADLVDANATLVAYGDPAGGPPREVLIANVAEASEAKLLEALALSDEKLIPVEVTEDLTGRLPLDHKHQLYERLATIAKSVNHHLKAGDGMPAHTVTNHAALTAQLDQLAGEVTTEADQTMVAYYQARVKALGERLDPSFSVAYGAGGKIPHIGPYETSGPQLVTKWVPAPAEETPAGLLAAQVRDASRIDPTIAPDGIAAWNGAARSKAAGKEYVVDLGGGYTAVYRPYGANDPATCDYTLRGALEISGPPGAGQGPELVNRLGQLNLVNRPMSAAEGEWTYLQRNIGAQRLESQPAVKTAQAQADGLEDAVEHLLLAERAHQAVGMNEPELHRFARQLRLDAEAQALPDKVRLLRDAVATATGHPTGAALAASPGYDPIPRTRAGWLTWGRFDVDADRAKVRQAFGTRGLFHSVTGGNLVEVLRTGVLASTERRHLMGITPGKGMSEGADKKSGGAASVFLRVGTKPASGPRLFWADPTVLLSRADLYAYPGDHFGAVNPKSHLPLSGQTRDPMKVAGFSGGGNEVMIRNGLDLLGAEAPTLIRCNSATQRSEVLALLASKGITQLGGRPVTDVVQ